MRNLRPTGSLLTALVLAGAAFGVCFWAASRLRQSADRGPEDELAWVCHEFQLSETEQGRVRKLHEGYQPQCEQMCDRIAGRNRDLAGLLGSATNVSPEIEQLLGEIAVLRAQCQAKMLRHFQEVARTMPGDRGARYLAEMVRLTLELHSREPGATGPAAVHESH